MRPALLIILASLVMTAGTELHQFFRIPVLINHYWHHRQENPSITLLEFLKLHYADNHPDDKDESEDAALPFKSAGALNHIDIPLIAGREILNKPYIDIAVTISIRRCEGVPCHRSFSIFRPPRFV
jgi:hypothetical protein